MVQRVENEGIQYIIPVHNFYLPNNKLLEALKDSNRAMKEFGLYTRASRAKPLWDSFLDLTVPTWDFVNPDGTIETVVIKDLIVKFFRVFRNHIIFHAMYKDDVLSFIVINEKSDVTEINNSLPLEEAY